MTDLCSRLSTHGVVEGFDIRTRRPWTGGVVLEVVGEVDGLTAPLLVEAARAELDAGSRPLVLDLAGVSFCSARCVGTLVEVRRLAEGHGARVRIARPSEKVRRAADLVQARDVLDGSTPLGALPGSAAGGQPAGDTRTSRSVPVGTVGARTPSSPTAGTPPRARGRSRAMAPRRSLGGVLLYGWPVLLVLHDADGIWHLLPTIPGNAREIASTSARRSSWTDLAAMDATLRELAGLPRGWLAAREHHGRPWQRQPY
jgi:anti-anti-sigma factor